MLFPKGTGERGGLLIVGVFIGGTALHMVLGEKNADSQMRALANNKQTEVFNFNANFVEYSTNLG